MNERKYEFNHKAININIFGKSFVVLFMFFKSMIS